MVMCIYLTRTLSLLPSLSFSLSIMDLLNAKHEQIFNFAPHSAIHIDSVCGKGFWQPQPQYKCPFPHAGGGWGGGRNTPTIFAWETRRRRKDNANKKERWAERRQWMNYSGCHLISYVIPSRTRPLTPAPCPAPLSCAPALPSDKLTHNR